MLEWDSQGEVFDIYNPLAWIEMWEFSEERAKEMREAENGYEK